MLRSMMTVSGFTAVSRVLGFLRDILIARFVGTGLVGDAFFAAFRFPNMFRRIFGEGAFNAAFVPLFGRKLEEEGKEPAMKFANRAFSTLLLVLGILMVIAIPCMQWVMIPVVPGFRAKFDKELSNVGQGKAFYEVTVKTTGARDIYFKIDGRSDASIAHWAGRVRVVSAHFIEDAAAGAGAVKSKVLGIVPEGGTLVPVMPEWKVEGAKDRNGNVIWRELENLELVGGEYRIGPDGVARIPLPRKHNYVLFEARVEVLGSADDVPPGWVKAYRNDPDTFGMTVFLARIMFCYLLFMALAAHLSGVLNTFKVFGMPEAVPIILNVAFLTGLALIWLKGWAPGPVLAWTVAIAGLMQCGALWLTCRLKRLPVRVVRPKFGGEMRRLFTLMGPGVVSAGIQQVNLLVGGIIASFQAGAISYLYYSDRVYQLPLGMIGIALGVVLLPEVTRQLRSGREREAAESIVKGIELGLLVTVPAAVAMLVIPLPLIETLFQRGEFGAESALQCGRALAGFSFGLPGYVLIKVLQPWYYAREDTKSPMYIAGISVAANIVVSLILFPFLQHVGIAIGTSVAAWVNVFLLWRGMHGGVKIRRREKKKIWRVLFASGVMGGVIWFAWMGIAGWFDGGQWMKVGGLALLVGLGMSVYGILVLLLRATSVAELKEGFSRGAEGGR